MNMAATRKAKLNNKNTINIGGLVKIVSTPQDENTAERIEASLSTKLLHRTDSGKLKGLDLANEIARLRVAIA